MPHDTPAALRATASKTEELNGEVIFAPGSAPMLAPPYSVYIFNLMPLEWKVEKGSAGTYTIKACELGEPYSDPLVLPSVVLDSYFVENEMKTHSVSGEFMAQDIIHPTIGANWSFGQNLDDLGVFWTKNKKPTDDEIHKCRSRMEATGRKILAMATSIETAGKLDDITPLMRVFATYFGEDRQWNRIYKKLAECPGCGDPVKPNIIRHSCGFVFDPDRALLANMISQADYERVMKLREEADRKPNTKTTTKAARSR